LKEWKDGTGLMLYEGYGQTETVSMIYGPAIVYKLQNNMLDK